MGRLLVLIGDWLLRNTIQKVLKGAGLAVFSYLAILSSVKLAFEQLINSAYTAPTALLSLMGIYGIDHVLSSLVSVAVFLLTLNQGKLFLKKA